MAEERQTPNGEERTAGLYRHGPEIEEEREVDFRFYLLAILNRRWMILTLTVIVVVCAAIYSFMQTPVYRSKAVLDLSPPPTYLVLPDASQSLYMRNESFLNTQFRALKSKALAMQVAENLSLTVEDVRKRGFTGKGKLTDQKNQAELKKVADILVRMVQILPVLDTNLCEIIFTTPDPMLSMTLANEWAEEYTASRLSSMQQYTRTTEELLMDQVRSLQKQIGDSERTLHDFSFQKDIIKIDKDKSLATAKFGEISNDLTNATKDRIAAEIRYQALRNSNVASIPEVQNHSLVVQRKGEYANLQTQYLTKSQLYKPEYPEMVRLREQIQRAEGTVREAQQTAYQEIIGTAYRDLQQAQLKESTLKGRLLEARKESADAGREELDYDRLAMEIENKKQLLATLLQKQNQTDVSAQVQEKAAPVSKVMEPADLPKGVHSPNIQKNILLALLAGFVGSVGLALLLDYFDRSLKSAEDVEQHLHLPYLGMVPFYVAEQTNGKNGSEKSLVPKGSGQLALQGKYGAYRLSVFDDSSSASEAIRTVRTSLLLSFPGGPPKSILVTSSRAGEGKTFIACNLAVALTQLNKSVVIIDADMRNPNVHRAWNIPNDMGLSIYLSNDVPVASVLKKPAANHLTLMTSGPKTPRPAELLASARFDELLRQCEKQYDFVIVDSPPVLPVADSVILASRVQSVLMVVRGGATPRDVVKMAKKKLMTSNPVIAGTVLNGIDLADPYYYYRYYSDYYAQYYGDTQKAPSNGNVQ